MLKYIAQSPLVMIRYNKNRGKGGRAVYARRNINKGELIEWAPCLMITEEEIGSDFNNHILPWYVFEWGEKNGKTINGLALGYVSLYNHSYEPNAVYEMGNEEEDCITIWALREIVKNEEITINYNGDPEDKTDVGFKVNGRRNNKSNLSPTINKKSKSSLGEQEILG